MKLVIDKIEYLGDILRITGTTSIGAIKGIWRHKALPIIGKSYPAELNVYKPKERIILNEQISSSVTLDGENVLFVGLCEDIDDEVYYLRFDIDWLDMLDIKVIANRKKKGDYISYSANWNDIEIYPYDLYS